MARAVEPSPPSSISPPSARFPAVVCALVAGGLLLALAVPRAIGDTLALPARPVIAALRAGQAVDARYLAIAADAQAAALDWLDDGPGFTALGLLRYHQARALDFEGAEARARLDEAIAAHRAGLARAPGQAHAWTRLAQLTLLRDGPTPALGPLLVRAVEAAPYDRRLAFRRIELAMIVWRKLDDRARAAIRQQIRFAATVSARRLDALAKRRYARALVIEALSPRAAP